MGKMLEAVRQIIVALFTRDKRSPLERASEVGKVTRVPDADGRYRFRIEPKE